MDRPWLCLLLVLGCGQQIELVGDSSLFPPSEELVVAACASNGVVTAEIDGCFRDPCPNSEPTVKCHTEVVNGAVVVDGRVRFDDTSNRGCYASVRSVCDLHTTCQLPSGVPDEVVLVNWAGQDIQDDTLCPR